MYTDWKFVMYLRNLLKNNLDEEVYLKRIKKI